MQAKQDPPAGATPALSADDRLLAELLELQESCRRLSSEIDTLHETLAMFRKRAAGLGVENADLRSQLALMNGIVHARCPLPDADHIEVTLPAGGGADAAARDAVTAFLRDRVPHGVLHRARLIVSELIADRGREPGAAAALVLRIESARTTVKLELDDPCRSDALSATDGAGSSGLHMLEHCSERWGGERLTRGGTRIWAQLSLLRPPVRALP